MTGPTVVIIGAGVVGAAIADELSAKGWTDLTIVDQGTLPKPGGSSSHAPGMVFQHHADRTMSRFAQYTVAKFRSLSFDGQPGFEQVGGLEIATTPERLADLRRRHGWAEAQGLNTRLIDAEECGRLHPLIDTDEVLGGMHCPDDGVARAVVAVNAQIASARARGVRVLESRTVTGLRIERGAITGVETDRGTLDADLVLCCAGIWGPLIAGWAGDRLPMTTVEHQVAQTAPLPQFSHHTAEATTPMIRHMDAGLYYRDRFDRLEIGSFAHRPIPVDPEELLSPDEAPIMPSMHPFTPEDFAPQWVDTQQLFPTLAESSVDEGYNGLMAFTQDDYPLLGPSPSVSGLWYAEAVWVTASAGVGLAVAEWLVDGQPTTFDLSACELSRFDTHQLAPDYHHRQDITRYREVYDIAHPLDSREGPRPLRTSPFHQRQRELGAVFAEGSGWERPLWYESNSDLLDPLRERSPHYSGWTAHHWSPIIGAEARAARRDAVLVDLSPLRRLSVRGPDAEALLLRATTGRLRASAQPPRTSGAKPSAIGRVTYCLLLDPSGRIRSDVTVTRRADRDFMVGAGSPRDLAWLREQAEGLDVMVEDITAGTCTVGLWGPRALDIIAELPSTIDFSPTALKYFRGVEGHLAGASVHCQRVSYIGEFGWEITTTADLGGHLWDSLISAGRPHGLIPAGRSAVDALRLEVGFLALGTDITGDRFPSELGLDFTLADRDDFVGAGRSGDSGQRLVMLEHDTGPARLLGGEPVRPGDGRDGQAAVGFIASADFSYSTGRSIATAWIATELSAPGTPLRLDAFDRPRAAEVLPRPVVTPNI